MSGNELLDKMELVDSAYVQAAETASAKKNGWLKWGVLAACCCLVILGTFAAIRGSGEKKLALPAEQKQSAEAPFSAEVPMGAAGPIGGIYEDMAPESDDAPLLSMFTNPDEPETESCYPAPQNGQVNYSVPLAGALAACGTEVRYHVVLFLFRDEIQLASDDEAVMAEMERLNAAGYAVRYETVEEGGKSFDYFALQAQMSQLAEFSVNEDYGYMLFFYGEVFRDDASSETDGPQISIETEPKQEYFPVSMTLSEARSDEVFGAYLPQEVPAGFSEEEILRYTEPGNQSLFAVWCSGYDEVDWQIRGFTVADRERLTGVDETENYDLSLYPIPRADSVPRELYQIVHDPIFEADELTMDVVMARAYKTSDAGDIDGWYMAFSVKYGGILVSVHAKGVEPEWVYRQLKALAQ